MYFFRRGLRGKRGIYKKANLFLSILLLPFAGYAIYEQGWSQINFHSVIVMCLIAISALAFMALNQISIKYLSTSNASLGSLLSPEFAALSGIIIYNEKLSLILLISMVLSISGTMLSVTAEKVTFLCKQHKGKINIMVSDVIMPKISGPQLFKKVVVLYEIIDAKVLRTLPQVYHQCHQC